MPYLPLSEIERKKNEQALAQPNISGQSNTIDLAAQNVAAPKTVKDSGAWTNLNTYLDANKDNAVDMGNKISTNINTQGDKTKAGILNTQNDFNAKSDAGTISNLDKAQSDADTIIGAARNNAYDSQINDENVNRFKEVSNAEYKGPNDISASDYYNEAQLDLNKTNDLINNSKTDEGRFNILQDVFNRPTYSQGQKSFDNLLILGNQEAKNNIVNAANSLNDLQSKWVNAINDASELAKQRTADSIKAREYAQSNLVSNRNTRTEEIDDYLKNIENDWSKEYDNLNNILSNYKGGDLELTRKEADQLALKNAGQGIYNLLNGIPASNYLDLQAYDANKVVSKDQFAQLAALDKLANQFGGNSISKFSDINQAGTLGLNNNFTGERFGQAADQADVKFNQLANDTNINAAGHGERAYYTGLFGQNRNVAKADASMDANLANFLNNGNFNFNGQAQQLKNPMDGGSFGNSNTGQVFNNLEDLGGAGLGAVDDLLGLGLWDDKSGTSQAMATNDANAQAQANFMSQLNELLNGQGYSNRLKIKE